jgi:alkanesulfonate monooxygenase SsuD/methylene tetrahydromethanopterin reductase-like flavin-dependent oxidoreductase (luciferase family)
LRTGRLGPLPSPEEAAAYPFTSAEKAVVEEAMSTHLIGDPDTVTEGLRQLQDRTGADEIMLSTRSHSYEGRVRSLSLIAQKWGRVSGGDDGDRGVGPGPGTGTG